MGVHPEPADHPELPAGELPPEPSGGGGEGRLPGVELAVPRGKHRHLRHMVHQHDLGGKGAQAGHLHPHVPGGGIQGGRFNRELEKNELKLGHLILHKCQTCKLPSSLHAYEHIGSSIQLPIMLPESNSRP